MPGGTKAAYEHLEPILTKIAAQVDDGRVTTLVLMVAGHYVKWFTTELSMVICSLQKRMICSRAV